MIDWSNEGDCLEAVKENVWALKYVFDEFKYLFE